VEFTLLDGSAAAAARTYDAGAETLAHFSAWSARSGGGDWARCQQVWTDAGVRCAGRVHLRRQVQCTVTFAMRSLGGVWEGLNSASALFLDAGSRKRPQCFVQVRAAELRVSFPLRLFARCSVLGARCSLQAIICCRPVAAVAGSWVRSWLVSARAGGDPGGGFSPLEVLYVGMCVYVPRRRRPRQLLSGRTTTMWSFDRDGDWGAM
jgi:hypothetical protein